jgi:hypothetical protein
MVCLAKYLTERQTHPHARRIMLKTDIQDVRRLKPRDVKEKYRNLPDNEKYRVGFIKELIDVKNNQLEVIRFDDEELEAILQYLCVY